MRFCNALSRTEGLVPFYEVSGETVATPDRKRPGYRLPTEAEWEYTCRAGAVTSRYYGGSVELLGQYASFVENSGNRAWPLGLVKPNDLGLFDMLGNVYEWCQGHAVRYPTAVNNNISATLIISPYSSEAHLHILRGGSFNSPAEFLRSALRTRLMPLVRFSNDGFRIAKTCN